MVDLGGVCLRPDAPRLGSPVCVSDGVQGGGGNGPQGGRGWQAQAPVGGGRGGAVADDEAVGAPRHHHGAALDLRRPAHGRRGDVGPARPHGLAVVPDGAARDDGARRGEGRVAAKE